MKKIGFFLLAFLLLIATGCTQEDLANRGLKQTVISAVMEEPSDTRSHATDEGKFTWSKGDEISVYTSSGSFRTFTLQGEGGTATSNFTGTLVDEESIIKCAAYPKNENHKANGNTLTFNLPAEYGDFTTEYVANTNAAMIALTDNSTAFNFKHIGGVLRFKLDNVPAEAAQFVFTATDKDITGDFDVDLRAATPTITAREKTTANSITIKFKPLESVQNDMTFFVPLPVGTYNGFTISMKKQDGTLLVDYENETSNTLKHKSLAKFPKLKFADVSGSLEGEEQEAGTLVNGVAKLKESGTLATVLGDQMLNITKLKVTGPLNGADIKSLRQMAACDEFNTMLKGNLTVLDLSEATIVESDDVYYKYNDSGFSYSYTTTDDEIGDYMFYNSKLKKIILPNSVTTIGVGAFYGCDALTSVTIPNGVTTIRYRAFYGCDALTNVTIPNSVTTIGYQAFAYCSKLTEVTCLATTPPTLNSSVFIVTNTLKVPKGTKAAYEASDWKNYFTNIVELSE